MIKVTDSALQELQRILSSSVDNSYARLRVIARGQGRLGLGIDVELPGDEVIQHNGSGLLLIEHKLASSLGRVTIDTEDTAEGTQLVIDEKS